jgi:RNA polymerase sigma factor (sigma-70 family)
MSALVGHAPVPRPAEPAELTQYLYEKYGQRVFTFCYSRLRNREEAQDAAQTTFIYVLRSLQRGVEPEFELAWLLKIAFNVCRGTRRSTNRVSAVTQEVEDIDELAAPRAAGYESNERLEALRDGLAHLPERQRRGILLREWQGLSYAEIADELGLSLAAVETLLFRARRNLASRLQHVRSGVGALNVASLAPFFRSLARGGLGKLGLIGAGASVALIPVVATEIAPALAERKPAVTLRPASVAGEPATGRPAVTHPALSYAAARATVTGARAAGSGAADAPQQPHAVGPAGTAESVEFAPGPSTGSEQPPATSPGTSSSPSPPPLPSPPSLAPPAPVPLDVPGLQPPAALPTVDTTLLNPLADALAGVEGALPLP